MAHLECGLKTESDPAIALLDIDPKKTKTIIRKDLCTPMFVAAKFTIAKVMEAT